MPESYQKKVLELSDIVGIKKDIFNPIKTFSGGMKRKLEIVRSLMHHPKVLFLDEPSLGLDPLSRKSLWEYLAKVRKTTKTTIFLTTHYLDEAEDADRVCILNEGKIIAIGTPGSIKSNLIQDYLLIDAKDRNKLSAELKRLKYSFNSEELIKVDIKNKNPQMVIQSIKTPLTILRIHTPSLEEAYLEIIGGKNE